MKVCGKCKNPKEVTEFGRCKTYPDGRTYECRECHNLVRREWSKNNRKKSNDILRKYLKANPEFSLFVSAKARAKKYGKPFGISRKDIVIPEVCPVLGIPLFKSGQKHSMGNSPSLDAIVPTLGYVPGNIAVISHRANTIKTNATPGELRKVADWLERQLDTPANPS